MPHRRVAIVCLALSMSACFSPATELPSRQPPPATADQSPRSSPRRAAPECTAQGSTCTADADCCGGTYCNNFTYGLWECEATRQNGTACAVDEQCQSGLCNSGTCAAAVCAIPGNACATTADCCAGTFCFNFTYAPWVCVSPRADGAFCEEDAHCQSHRCAGWTCSAAVCTALGEVCETDDECCTGSWCRTAWSYLPDPSSCTSAAGTGAYCNTDRQCVSLNCANHACAP